MQDLFKNQKLKLLKFVHKEQDTSDISENSFIVVTNKMISVFNEDKKELAHFTGLAIHSANLIDHETLYLMQGYQD